MREFKLTFPPRPLPVTSSQCCERLQNEREEVRVSLEEASKRLQEQHKEELVQLEDRCAFTSVKVLAS